MPFEELLDHRCDIYHVVEEMKTPGYGLPTSPSFSYGEAADLSDVPCHFTIGGTLTTKQNDPQNDLEARVKIVFPLGTDLRINDKVVDRANGLKYTLEVPRQVREHHAFAYAIRTREQQPL